MQNTDNICNPKSRKPCLYLSNVFVKHIIVLQLNAVENCMGPSLKFHDCSLLQ